MYDIFLSYASEDIEKSKRLATALEKQGWSVFWDRSTLLAGQDFEDVIEQAIDQSACMIVGWSTASKKSDWVKGEANIGRERRILVPILFETINQPIAFRGFHAENFSAWNGEIESDEFSKLTSAVERLAGPGKTGGAETSVAHTTAKTAVAPRKQVKSGLKTSTASDDTFIEPEMVEIPAGRFHMGGNKRSSKQPIHQVNIAKPFSVAKYPVTFEQYELYVKANDLDLPSDEGWGQGKRPVININWDDAQAYAKWLSDKAGKPYRLPSEAEWEYAARAGTISDYYWDDEENVEDYAWFDENSNDKTHPVGQKKPNAFGLYDMSGNVWEWVQDCWHESYEKAPDDGSPWLEKNGGDCSLRVLRGGSWLGEPSHLRSALRIGYDPDSRDYFHGFRLAQD